MIRPTGYSITNYGDMITDRPRMEAYAQALRKAVRPGCVVLDIGAGTGVFSLLACQLGAGQVHAVEPHEAILVARAAVAANGCADCVTFHQNLSAKVSLSAPADVIVSDLRGVLPLLQHHIPSIVDARERLLATGGHLIPQVDTLWAAMVQAPDIYRPYQEPWLRNDYGLDLRSGHRLVVNSWCRVQLKPEQLLVQPQEWATLDYRTVYSPNVAGKLNWIVEQAGTTHGLAVWFDATLGDEAGFSNAPSEPALIYGQAFFPLPEPVSLAPGDEILVELRADLIGDDYMWQWRTQVNDSIAAKKNKVSFDQSTFFGTPLSLDQLRLREASYAPSLSDEGQADRYLLSLMDGQTTLSEIANLGTARFPGCFASLDAALARAGELSVKYSRQP